jgi:FkbM family methyltransferase
VSRKVGFVLTAVDVGSMIVNRFDDGGGYGVGHDLLERSVYEVQEATVALQLLSLRRQAFGDGVFVVDCGANIGVHTVGWAKSLTGWGSVLAIEAQERLYYALAGNIALNNCFNAHAMHAAIGARDGLLRIPRPDYLAPGSFGSLELRHRVETEFIGQPIDYAEAALTNVRLVTLDSLRLPRLDLLKIDVEGMELDVLEGAKAAIERFRPVVMVEQIKVSGSALAEVLGAHGYRWFTLGLNLVAVHALDPSWSAIKIEPA